MASHITDFSKMTMAQLREQLKSRGLPVSGAKATLIDRLTESFLNEEKILNADVSMPKDSLDEVLDVSVNEEDVLGPTSPDKKPKTDETLTNVPIEKLKETNEVHQLGKSIAEPEEFVAPKQKRAERFGLPPTAEQMKQIRAERFGLANASSGSDDSVEEKKRKRAERFGLNVNGKHGNAASNVTDDEKDLLRKRAERFGLELRDGAQKKKNITFGEVDIPSADVLERRAKRFGISNERAEMEIKKQKRAERFGLNRT